MARWSIGAALLAGALALLLAATTVSGSATSTRHRSPFRGLGTWVDIYATEWADPEAAVTAMAQHGVRTLYLETGNYRHRTEVFRPATTGRFIDAAHAAGMRIVAWYLPSFRSIKTDARKARAAIRFRSAKGERFDGFALDIEATAVRSLKLRNHRLLVLSARLHHAVPRRYPLGAITPSPVGMSPTYWPGIPYRSLTRFYKAFLPMAYSTLRGIHGRARTAAFLTATVSAIRTASGHPKFPIHLVGGLTASMRARESAGFVDAVAKTKPFGYSLYAFGQTTPIAWKALTAIPPR
jgi:hypothetical protein